MDREALIEELFLEIRRTRRQDEFDDAASERLGITPRVRCMDILDLHRRCGGAVRCGERLSTGALTTVSDRLEQVGYLRRVRDSRPSTRCSSS